MSVSGSRWTLPNLITLTRIAACPVIFVLALSPDVSLRFWAFGLYVVAAVTDIWDGHIARSRGLVTDMGKLLDPLADKLLLAASFIPIYWVTQNGTPSDTLPLWGAMPLWVMLVVFGREIFITLFRSFAARRGVVIAAGTAGKRKALFQSIFAGGALLWLPLQAAAESGGWSGGLWTVGSFLLAVIVAITLGLAIVLTVYSMLDYLWSYRNVMGIRD